jgi:Putative abortive phage resistance protein AbiGi, antitoxin
MSPYFGKNSSNWTDMSDYVVHFTRAYDGTGAYDNMISILANQVIKARNPFGLARNKAPIPKTQHATCFSEVPLHLLSRLAKARSEYGIVFRKDTIIHRGGNPIMYAYKDHEVTNALKILVELAAYDSENPIWSVTPFVDAPGDYTTGKYFFEWEREWRKLGEFKFAEVDVEFLVIPSALHEAARAFFDNAKADNLGPCYDCPFIDPYWKIEKIKPLLL